MATAGPARGPPGHREPVRLGGGRGGVARRRRSPSHPPGPRPPLSAALRGRPGGAPPRGAPDHRRPRAPVEPRGRRAARVGRPRVHGRPDDHRRRAHRVRELRRRPGALSRRADQHRARGGDPARDRARPGPARREAEGLLRGSPAGAGPARPGPEDGGDRPARRRDRPRLQQPADGHRGAEQPAPHEDAARRPRAQGRRPDPDHRPARRRSHPAAARVQPQAGARAEGHQSQGAGGRA